MSAIARLAASIETVPANLRGIGLMVLSGALYSVMMTIIRWISTDIHPIEQVFFRILFGLAAVMPFFVRGGWPGVRSTTIAHYTRRPVVQAAASAFFHTGLARALLHI